jgi:hypothetical protein
MVVTHDQKSINYSNSIVTFDISRNVDGLIVAKTNADRAPHVGGRVTKLRKLRKSRASSFPCRIALIKALFEFNSLLRSRQYQLMHSTVSLDSFM